MRIRTQKIFLNMFQFFTTFPFHTPDIVSFGFLSRSNDYYFYCKRILNRESGWLAAVKQLNILAINVHLFFYFSLISASC